VSPFTCFGNNQVSIADNIDLSIFGRLQPVYYHTSTDEPVYADRDVNDFRLRRARLLVKGTMDGWASFVVQTGYSEEPESGSAGARIVDAYVHLAPSAAVQILAGEFLAPASRQNLTYAGTLMAFDNPGVTYKSLSWGGRALTRMSSQTIAATDSGLRGSVDVRDTGVLFFGNDGTQERGLHYKYYLGVFDGARSADSERISTRVQINLGDPEPAYYQKSTYYGGLDTVGLGLSVDTQTAVAQELETGNEIDYRFYSADVFMEKPLASQALSLEAAWLKLELDDALTLVDPFESDMSKSQLGSGLAAQGTGFYLQAGLTVEQWQPWLEYEAWNSDAEASIGDYSSYRVGLTYIFSKFQAEFKIGFEHAESDHAIVGNAKSLNTLASGLFITF